MANAEMRQRIMPQQDSIDFVVAFAIGAILGAGLALLIRPAPPTPKERILRDLEPYRKKMRKSAKIARRGFETGTGATGEIVKSLRDASRTVISDFRDEVAEIIAAARDDVADAIDRQVDQARRAIRSRTRRL